MRNVISGSKSPRTASSLAATLLCALAVLPAHAQAPAASPPAPASGPGPATQPPPAPGTTQPAPTQPAPAPAATPPPNYNIQYNGLIDGYYQFQFHNPKGSNILSGTRVYDIRHDTPTLNLAELNVFKNPRPGGFGFKTTLIAGDTADINHLSLGSAGVTQESRFKNIQQLYGTYSFGANGAGLDFGKFYTPFGYEVTEANGNYNYSRSLPYFLLPIYHAGARIYTPVPGANGLTATAYVVNAIFNTQTAGVHNDSKRAKFIGQLNFTDPKGKFTLIGTLGLGKDKLGGVDTKVTLNDDDFTYNINAASLFGLNYTYGKTEPDGGTKTTVNGYAAYYRQQLNPKDAVALRFSGFTTKTDGVNDTKPYEITATYEYKAAANLTTRLEYRHDRVNSDNGAGIAFSDSSGNPTKSDQDTLTLAGLFTF